MFPSLAFLGLCFNVGASWKVSLSFIDPSFDFFWFGPQIPPNEIFWREFFHCVRFFCFLEALLVGICVAISRLVASLTLFS